MKNINLFFEEVSHSIKNIDKKKIYNLILELRKLQKNGGRLVILGVGGSAANASHAVNDFRKICKIDAYTPVDNVAELTARTNDEGWETQSTEDFSFDVYEEIAKFMASTSIPAWTMLLLQWNLVCRGIDLEKINIKMEFCIVLRCLQISL